MKRCAVILNSENVVKVTNFPRKYDKLTSNPQVKILEECELDEIEERYNYWKNTYVPKKKPKEEDTFEYDTSEFCSALIYNENHEFICEIKAGTYQFLTDRINEKLNKNYTVKELFNSNFYDPQVFISKDINGARHCLDLLKELEELKQFAIDNNIPTSVVLLLSIVFCFDTKPDRKERFKEAILLFNTDGSFNFDKALASDSLTDFDKDFIRKKLEERKSEQIVSE